MTTVVRAQSCTAGAPGKVGINQQFQYVITLDQKGTISSQDFGTFTKTGGPYQSTSTSFSFANGQQTSSYTCTFTFTLKPTKLGKQTIPGVTCNAGGKQVKSNAVTIEVTKEDQQSQQQQRRQHSIWDDMDQFFDPWGQQSQRQQNVNAEMFIRATASNTSPYEGEDVVVSYKLYCQNVAQFQVTDCDLPQQTNLWTNRLDDPNAAAHQTTEVVDGKKYDVYEFYRISATPQKSGDISISPLSIKALYIPRSFWASTMEKSIQSNSVVLHVKPLPQAGRPADFNGLVGNFSLSSALTPQSLRANEAAELTLTVTGKGNLQLLEAPLVEFPSGLDVTAPTIEERGGSKTFNYIIIPRTAGSYTIPSVSFSYFDPQQQKYKTLQTEAYTLSVEKGDSQITTSEGYSVQLGNDILGLKEITGPQTLGRPFFASLPYFLLLLSPIPLFLLVLFLWRFRLTRRGDTLQFKAKRANRVANRRLKKAQKLMSAGKEGEFYEEISHVLWDYMSDKFHIPLAELSMDSVRLTLSNKGVPVEDIDGFIRTLNECEFARFAPGDNKEMMGNLFELTRNFITQIEKK